MENPQPLHSTWSRIHPTKNKKFKNKKKKGILVRFHTCREDLLRCIPVCSAAGRSWLSSLLPSRDLSTSTSPGAFSQPLLTPEVLLQSLCSKSTGCAPHLDPTLQTWPRQSGAGGFAENEPDLPDLNNKPCKVPTLSYPMAVTV